MDHLNAKPSQIRISVNLIISCISKHGNKCFLLQQWGSEIRSFKTGNIWNPDYLKIGFQMVQFSKGPWGCIFRSCPTHLKYHDKILVNNLLWTCVLLPKRILQYPVNTTYNTLWILHKIENWTLNILTFMSGFQMVWQNGCHLSQFQMVGLPDFRSHSKSRLVLISDSHCLQ